LIHLCLMSANPSAKKGERLSPWLT
jgi:hypothetical protein